MVYFCGKYEIFSHYRLIIIKIRYNNAYLQLLIIYSFFLLTVWQIVLRMGTE